MGASQSSEVEGDAVPTGEGQEPRLYKLASLSETKWPIVYSPMYNISFWGLQNIHPFDSGKWGKIYQYLIDEGLLKGSKSIVQAHEANETELKVVHTDRYIDSLTYSKNVAVVVEVPPVALLFNSTVQERLLKPFRYATGGTIMAGKLAKERGWAINIGGGFHHCSGDEGGGFCAYADITLSIHFMFRYLEGISKVMIVDLDAHQGNGHERDFLNDDRVYILDMYNRWIYPNDREAKAGIDAQIELEPHTGDREYLDFIRRRLPQSLDEFDPDMVVYNAGTDVLVDDPLGQLDITPNGVVSRDQIVFSEVRKRNIPVFMITSGGYQRNNARVIADSIINLRAQNLIVSPEDDPHVTSELRTQGVSVDPPQEVTDTASIGSEQAKHVDTPEYRDETEREQSSERSTSLTLTDTPPGKPESNQ